MGEVVDIEAITDALKWEIITVDDFNSFMIF